MRARLRDLHAEHPQPRDRPLDNPRYVIPRYVEYREDTWLSHIMPHLVGQHFQRSKRSMQMLHAVPALFARNRELATTDQRHWNAHVSPGEAAIAQRGDGERLLERALQTGTVPQQPPHRKEVFLCSVLTQDNRTARRRGPIICGTPCGTDTSADA